MANSINFSTKKNTNFDRINADSILDSTLKITNSLILNGSQFIVNGGSIDIDAAIIDLFSNGGNLRVNATGSAGAGGDIFITATEGGNSGGDIFITATDGTTGTGGSLQLNAFDTAGAGGNITMNCFDTLGGGRGGGNFTVTGDVTGTTRAGLNTVLQSTTGQSHFIINANGASIPTLGYSVGGGPFGPIGGASIIGNDHCGMITLEVGGPGIAINDVLRVTYGQPFLPLTTPVVTINGGDKNGVAFLQGTFNGTRNGGLASVNPTNTFFDITFHQSPFAGIAVQPGRIIYQVVTTDNI